MDGAVKTIIVVLSWFRVTGELDVVGPPVELINLKVGEEICQDVERSK